MAKTQGSTVEVLKKLNPAVAVLRPGHVLKYRKASVQRVITSWRYISTTLMAQRYNGGRDINYATKLDYVLKVMQKGRETVCAR
uniref:hypothetical protein n=1 Tax=Burkholderia metallica TaxID=488729 RepID=UPI001FC8C85F|nr:hypothetical protein [Burkholderia metallica]